MGDTITFGEESGSKESREAAEQAGLPNASVDVADVQTYIDEYTKISKTANWETMNLSTAMGVTDVGLDNAYARGVFDGRYVYFCADSADTFLRFDTQGQFAVAGDWAQMSISTVQGAAAATSDYEGLAFDGRYVYFGAYFSDTFLRFDTKGTSFTTAGDWEQMSMSTAQGATFINSAYIGSMAFDGRYIYYSPFVSDTFLRFDTQGTSFTTAGDWETMSMSTAQGATFVGTAYWGSTFDGRYIYFSPYDSDTFLRFNTQGTSFVTAADWETMAMSTAQGGTVLDEGYMNNVFDGRYIYFSPYDSDTFLRFNTQGTSFTAVADWEKMSMSTAQGSASLEIAYDGLVFDGRYVYYSARNSDTFVRFDTQGTSFSTTGDWSTMSVSTAQGAASVNNSHKGAVYDGKYVYFVVNTSETFLRVLATSSTFKP